jgi:hypothetical protein
MNENAPAHEHVSIGFSRLTALAFAAIFAFVAVNGASRAVAEHDVVRLVVVLAVFGGIAAAFLARALRRAPVVGIDEQGPSAVRGRTGRQMSVEGEPVLLAGRSARR